ncbi:tetratricopeptide repeat protein [unidentified bacterial endosymbiont]|uniref:tetratricopeptide repeat protein n=1 Tax=unidentified bacterial endosymbiont TaxID=2355 RepID=UPI00344FB1EA
MKSRRRGCSRSQVNLGCIYHDPQYPEHNDGFALRCFHEAAKQGYILGQYNLEVMYFNGRVVTKDHKVAAAWFQKAADQGCADSQRALAAMVG